ncbi:MAG: calcium-binding protein [Pseudomonas sp.]|uniref:calcium-binding protein n=1 Tax=Pseudomonas sp. TaxID=306 RepID=UPI0033954054
MEIIGTSGNDTLVGNDYEQDILRGGLGNDYLVDNGQYDDDQLYGGTGNDTLHSSGGNSLLDGGDGSDVLHAYSGGNSTLLGGDGHDWLSGGWGKTHMQGGLGNDNISGGQVDDLLQGDAGDDQIQGGDGNDILEGGVGDDVLDGGNGRDTYRFSRGWGKDHIYNENSTSGSVDVIEFAADILPGDIAFSRSGNNLRLSLKGASDYVWLYDYFTDRSKLQEIRFANGSVWTYEQIRSSFLQGTDGNDNLMGFDSADTLAGGLGNDQLSGLAGNDLLQGGAGNDSLDGGMGDDRLLGGEGADTLRGGAGNDTYVVEGLSDTLLENAGEGIDTVESSVSLSLAGNLENLTLTGSAALDATGNALTNVLLGNGAANTLKGGEGDDRLVGGAGNDNLQGGVGSDVYFFGRGWGQDYLSNSDLDSTAKVDAIEFAADIAPGDILISRNAYLGLVLTLNGSSDKITVANYFHNDGNSQFRIEEIRFADGTRWSVEQVKQMLLQGGEGNDSLLGYATDDLLTGLLGNDTLSGDLGNDWLQGGEGNDYLRGGAGNDLLQGDGGNDEMRGEGGDDRYQVDSTLDILVESADQGIDSVESSVAFSLGNHFENLTLTGAGSISGYGNALNNQITGNAAANSLIGGLGDDRLFGQDGNDSLQGSTGQDSLYGGAGNDNLNGAAGDDWLLGGAGNDTFYGGTGNDVYQVDAVGDQVSEMTNEGIDTVESSVSYTLMSTLEHLTLSGSAQINGIGNGSDNLLKGNDAANTLLGKDGNDTLQGGAGNDLLVGGAGSDTYLFGRGAQQDTLDNQDLSPTSLDTLLLGEGVAAEDLWFRQNGAHLEVSLIGHDDKAILSNWYAGADFHLDQFKTSEGRTLLDSQVQNLVDAMAAFAVPAGAELDLTISQREQLNTVIAANWQ